MYNLKEKFDDMLAVIIIIATAMVIVATVYYGIIVTIVMGCFVVSGIIVTKIMIPVLKRL